MSARVTFIVPPDTKRKIDLLGDLSVTLPLAVKSGMDYSLSIIRGRIQRDRLSGRGPYPPSEHRLGIVTQQLQRSLREEPAVIAGDTITASIGSPVFYGALHEYGWSGTVRRGATSYKMTIPERAPVRTGVAENADFMARSIVDAVDKLLNEISK